MEDRCVVCNKIIPEGRMVCPSCERAEIKLGIILQSIQVTEKEVQTAYDFMEENNDD